MLWNSFWEEQLHFNFKNLLKVTNSVVIWVTEKRLSREIVWVIYRREYRRSCRTKILKRDQKMQILTLMIIYSEFNQTTIIRKFSIRTKNKGNKSAVILSDTSIICASYLSFRFRTKNLKNYLEHSVFLFIKMIRIEPWLRYFWWFCYVFVKTPNMVDTFISFITL